MDWAVWTRLQRGEPYFGDRLHNLEIQLGGAERSFEVM
jgi:hypothetical protein